VIKWFQGLTNFEAGVAITAEEKRLEGALEREAEEEEPE
tara:strand:+ start:556 stop:672 length:117 start_codon:yes stop_codon:yes gene_type:complete